MWRQKQLSWLKEKSSALRGRTRELQEQVDPHLKPILGHLHLGLMEFLVDFTKYQNKKYVQDLYGG